MAAERIQLPIITDPDELRKAVAHIQERPNEPIVAHMPTLEQYVEAVFGANIATTSLMAQSIRRPEHGIGAHWDIHSPHLHPEFPFVATYNRRGSALLRATTLDAILARHYSEHFPNATHEARDARRAYSGVALATASTIYEAIISPGTGLIVSQSRGGAPVVHDVSPIGGISERGEFLKLVVPAPTEDARTVHVDESYTSYNALIKTEATLRAMEEARRAEAQAWARLDEERRTIPKDSFFLDRRRRRFD